MKNLSCLVVVRPFLVLAAATLAACSSGSSSSSDTDGGLEGGASSHATTTGLQTSSSSGKTTTSSISVGTGPSGQTSTGGGHTSTGATSTSASGTGTSASETSASSGSPTGTTGGTSTSQTSSGSTTGSASSGTTGTGHTSTNGSGGHTSTGQSGTEGSSFSSISSSSSEPFSYSFGSSITPSGGGSTSSSSSETGGTSSSGQTSSEGSTESSSTSAPPTCLTSATCAGGTSCLGGACLPQTLLLFAGTNGSALLGAEYQVGGTWKKTNLGDGTNVGVSLAVDSSGRGIGVYASTTDTDVGFTTWSGGAWAAGAAITGNFSEEQPFLDATDSSTAYVTYQDTSHQFWSVSLTGDVWGAPLAIGPIGDQDFGPEPATIAALGGGAVVAFADGANTPDINYLATSTFGGVTWSATDDVTGPSSFLVSPSIVALTGPTGPELLVTYVGYNEDQMYFTARTGGVWSNGTAIANCSTGTRIALAALPDGDAILAFQGTDSNLYWTRDSGGAWSAVAPVVAAGVVLDSGTSPAITAGIGSDDAELVYVSGGAVYFSSLTGTTWSTPSVALSADLGVNGVALAASPGLTVSFTGSSGGSSASSGQSSGRGGGASSSSSESSSD